MFWIITGAANNDDKLIRLAQSGDMEARETLIAEHLGFIKQLVLKNVTGYEDISNREEFSVGLMAFNEAITSYKTGLRSFRSFAADVIKRRLIDYQRSIYQHRKRLLCVEDLPKGQLSDHSVLGPERVEQRLEFESFVESLARYGISLQDLVADTPKHNDSRLLCLRVARVITEDPALRIHFEHYGTIPLQMVLARMKINRKTVERHRKYIIALCLVLLSDLDTIKEYIRGMEEGGAEDA